MYLLAMMLFVDHDPSSDDYDAALDNTLCYVMTNCLISYVMTDHYKL